MSRARNFIGNKHFRYGLDTATCRVEECQYEYPTLFNLYSEWIFGNCEDEISLIGIQVGGTRINHIRYADDTVVIAESEDDLQRVLNSTNQGSNDYGLKINIAETKTMIVSKSNNGSHFKTVCCCCCCCDYPFSSSGWRYGTNDNSDSCRQPN